MARQAPIKEHPEWLGIEAGDHKGIFGQTNFGHRVLPSLANLSVANSNFGQTKLGQHQLWPNQLWPAPTLAKTKTNFGWPNQVWQTPNFSFWWVLVRGKWSSGPRKGRASEGKGPQGREGPRRRGPEPIGWGPKGGAPKGWRPKNFALFFPLPPQFSFFFPSLGGPFVEFWCVFEAGGPKAAPVV